MAIRPRHEPPDILFDAPIQLDESLTALWEQGEEYGPLSPRRYMRYWQPGNLLIKEKPRDMFDGDISIEGMQFAVDETQRHMAMLGAACGLRIVSHVNQVNQAFNPEKTPSTEDIVLFAASKYIIGGKTLDHRASRQELSRARIERAIAQPLLRYLDMCSKAEEPYVLHDIYRFDQHIWHPKTDIIGLVDTDPFFQPSSAERLDAYEKLVRGNVDNLYKK